MKNHLKKIIVFIVNAAVVLVGVFLIKNYEKNKISSETSIPSDSQTQSLETDPASIADEAVNQADFSADRTINNYDMPKAQTVSSSTLVSVSPTVPSSSTNSSTPAKAVSTPKTKTS